ncbi:hypothetical protein SY89_03537 [Halolamina pelagica]|uniref:DUF1508 domain-containing protein n=1 Tax=Halolamina pelagica TaxID=699431 RepID=A0A0P7GJZ2_9EURY|nr:hypothetical protein SY89_03537 [Halolamina pelagica]
MQPTWRPNDGGYYELKQATDGQYHFTLKAGNHEVICSERYTTRSAAENGIESCRTNSATMTAMIGKRRRMASPTST